MLTTVILIVMLLAVLAALPYMNTPITIDERDGDEPLKLRMKPTRQR